MSIKKTKISGISLIEVLIAAGVLSLVLGSTVAVSRTITRNQLIVQDRTQAYALASEALEIIRALRDGMYIDKINNSYDSFLPNVCVGVVCDLELIWDNPTSNWQLVQGDTQYDLDNGGEVVTVNLASGNISDNTTRAKSNPVVQSPRDCTTTNSGEINYCRRIEITPVVYDDGNDGNYTTNVDQYSLPLVVTNSNDNQASVTNATKELFTFDSFLQGSMKVNIYVTWQEFGKQHEVKTTDIITNWR